MIIQKSICWLFLMLINVPMLFVAMVSSFAIQLFDMPFELWNNVTEFFSDET